MILNLDDFEKKKKTPISPHDYDLLFHLLLLKKIKRLKKVIIIGLPPSFSATLPLKNERHKTYKDQRRG